MKTCIVLLVVIFALKPSLQNVCNTNADCTKINSSYTGPCYMNNCYLLCVFNSNPCTQTMTSSAGCVSITGKNGTYCMLNISMPKTTTTALPTTTTQPTTTTLATTTTAPCENKVGPNGTSDCVKVAYLCNNTIYYRLMTEQCPKTCGRCKVSNSTSGSCADKFGPTGQSDCSQVAFLCNNALYYNLMTQQCPMTCGRCGGSSSTSASCVDKTGTNGVSDCQRDAYLCNNQLYYQLMTQQCPKTCGRC